MTRLLKRVLGPAMALLTVWMMLLLLHYDACSGPRRQETVAADTEEAGRQAGDIGITDADEEDPFLPIAVRRAHKIPPQGLYDHIYFSLFDYRQHLLYTNVPHTRGWMARLPTLPELEWFADVQRKAAAALSDAVTPLQCYSIRYRLVVPQGVELEVMCSPTKNRTLTVSLLEPLTDTVAVGASHIASTTSTLHVAMALSGRRRMLKIFLNNLRLVVEAVPQSITLTVVYFEDGNSTEVGSDLAKAEQVTPGLVTELLVENKPFSRGVGLRIALEKTNVMNDEDVVWICDVDMAFKADFVSRCRGTPLLGQQVFFPVPFSQYNPDLTKQMQGPVPDDNLTVREEHGYWRLYGHGNVCAYRADLLSVGAFQGHLSTSWGGEDLQLLQQFAAEGKIRIIRALEPGLIHRYHRKRCEALPADVVVSCLMVRISNEASKNTFGQLYFNRSIGKP